MRLGGIRFGGIAPPRRRLALLGGGGLLLLVLALAIAQLVLPRIASKAIRDRVARYGSVRSVSVSAFPAVELLWGEADSASVDAHDLTISPEQLISLLLEGKDVDTLDVQAQEVKLDGLDLAAAPLVISAARLRKRGSSLQAEGLLTAQALEATLPPGVGVQILRSSVRGGVSVIVTGGLFGFDASIRAFVEAREGKLELVPAGPLLRTLATVTLINDPRARILTVSATPRPGGAWVFDVSAELR
jgi:LmeA-like phospholipid-binding